ncbi:SLAM family member 5 [Apodemus speciosus]|uniref:SLAM family member 5 n=1 Tax=Apodemus speciosus TaxID=105296 RepID=A0ABQ0EFT0_APOSI
MVIYKGRIEVIGKNYDLVIRDLMMEDAGTYIADINEENPEKTITKIYHLHIYRRLEKPKITQSLIPSLNNTCNVTLTCSVEKEGKNVTYSWSPSGEKSNVLRIFHSPMDQKLTYTSDDVSKKTVYSELLRDTRLTESRIYDELDQSKK